MTNEYWAGVLSGAQDDPRLLDATRSVLAGLSRVTPEDVQKAARTYLGDDKSWLLLVKPEAAATAATWTAMDAAACYNRIITYMSSLCERLHGLPKMHA